MEKKWTIEVEFSGTNEQLKTCLKKLVDMGFNPDRTKILEYNSIDDMIWAARNKK